MDYSIPLFDLNYDAAEENAVLETLRSRWISTGPRTTEFESLFSELLGVRHALALANCTVALHLALRVLGIGAGDEVIVPSLTFVATVNAIRYVGAVPVFCDIRSTEDLTLDPDRVEALVTERTKAVVVMHYAGFPCDMARIMDTAARHGLKVVEDACHAPLSDYEGRKLGTVGDIGCFSFFSNKNISTGEGGMLVTDSADYDAHARLLRSHGMTSLSYERSRGHATAYDVVELGYNYRMDDIRASIGIVQLRKLRRDLEERARVRRRYLEGLAGADGLIIPFAAHQGFVSNYIMPVVLADSTAARRDRIREDLGRRGIQTSVHYPPVHRFSIYEDYRADLSLTDYVADNEITLPLFSRMTDGQVDFVCRSLGDLLRG
jgi:dTDP-4-amino-4,6-dideoxygalactose transaminase